MGALSRRVRDAEQGHLADDLDRIVSAAGAALEAELATLAAAMSSAGFYQQDPGAVAAHAQRMAVAQAELDAAYARWAELDG